MKSETLKIYSGIINHLALTIPTSFGKQGFRKAVISICNNAKIDGIHMGELYNENLGAFEQLGIEVEEIL